MDWQNKMNEIIDYLEERMCEEIDLEKAARHAGYSLWEFQRIFSFMTNTTVGAYIRRRKLSLAFSDIMSSDEKIIDIALKYGYESSNAFSRAFNQLFGISPSFARDERIFLELYPKLIFDNKNIIKRSITKMKIAVVFGSHRKIGKNKEIEEMLIGLNLPHEFDFIRMADTNISYCTACGGCWDKKECVIDDDFKSILQRLIEADAIFLIVPVYALIPAKFTALLERLTSWQHGTLSGGENNPLLGKKVGIFTYCSCFICQDDDLKNIFRKFLVTEEWTGKGGLSDESKSYRYLTDDYLISVYANQYSGLPGPDNVFNHDIVEYVKSVALWLK